MNEIAVRNRAAESSAIEWMPRVWQVVLGRSPIRPEDDFFELGGDSLLALQLFAEIEKQTGRQIPITAIYDASTVAALASLVDRGVNPRSSPLVLLKSGTNEPPLFIIHGVGGAVMELSALGRSMQCDHPIYAVQAQGLDGLEAPHERVEDMAKCYLTAIRGRQPRGPYLLAGYSFGGLVALEVAQLLREAGEPPALVVCLDTYIHPQYWPFSARLGITRRKLVRRLGIMARAPLSETLAFAQKQVKRARGGMKATRYRPVPDDVTSRWFPVDLTLPLPVQQVHRSGLAALARHRPRYYPGKVVFLQPTEVLHFPGSPTTMWRRLTHEFELHRVPGDHRAMIGSQSHALAEQLSACVEAALGKEQTK